MDTIEHVTAASLRWKMTTTGVKIKHISADTGIGKANICAWINGKRPMSHNVRVMFFYYFKHKDNES